MELFRSNPIHVCCNDDHSIGIDMVRTLKDIGSFLLYWLFIGTAIILFFITLLGLMLIDFVMETFTKITRSFKKHD